MRTRIKLRRDTAANWTENNPILALGEPGIETDSNRVKYGDGVTAWSSLAYAGSSGDSTIGSSREDTLETVFAMLINQSDFSTVKSTNGTNWTGRTGLWITEQQGPAYGLEVDNSGTNMTDMALGNGCVVYVDYSPWDNQFGIWRAPSLEAYPTKQNFSIAISGFDTPRVEWAGVEYLGGYFVVYGKCYDIEGLYRPTPVFAYSTDGITWTQGSVNKTYIDTIYTTQNGLNADIDGLGFTGVAYNGTGWLFNLDFEYDSGNTINGEGFPGGFYVTSLSTTLGSANFDETPSYDTSLNNRARMTWTGSRWLIADNTYNWDTDTDRSVLWYNTSSNPRLGTWTDIEIAPISFSKFGQEASDNWNRSANPVLAVAAGTIGGTTWTVLGLGDGQVLTTSDFSNWYGAVPKPITYTIDSFTDLDPGTEIVLNWDENTNPNEADSNVSQSQYSWSGKVTITTNPGATTNIPPGTYYANNGFGGSTFTLYTDAAQTTPVNSSAWAAYTGGDSTITFSRGYDSIEHAIIQNSMILVADDDDQIHRTTAGNLSQAFTEVVWGREDEIGRLVYGTITRLANSWEATDPISGKVNQAALSSFGFRAVATDNYSSSRIEAYASGWELATITPHDPAYNGGENGNESLIEEDTYAGIYNEDWVNNIGPKLDISIEVPESIHTFDRYGNIRIEGPLIYGRRLEVTNPPTTGVNSTNFETEAFMLRNLRNGDVAQTNSSEGWYNLIIIDSGTVADTEKHHYLPVAPDGTEITFICQGTNQSGVLIWVNNGQAGDQVFTDSSWFPFRLNNGAGGGTTRAIAKAVCFGGRWYFDNDAWWD